MSESIERERQIFGEALEMDSPEEQRAFVRGACGGDTSLQQAVEGLLEAYSRASGFIPPRLADASDTPCDPASSEPPGTIIGRYKLLEKIGEGGMGVVYMAEQEEPVRRKVALKIIKLGMDTRQVVARFEAERQALALMEHPNIAKVLDGGATDTGRPYFVMELVTGVPITEFCDQNQLSTEDRLKLFIPVCQAIQSAHQKGIIHRDIKPTNILVTLNAGVPMPMVIDFGVAKATQQKLTEKTLFTHYATMIGTPAYMSPEQAEMSRLDVDTRSDIYGLGVLLYELLTGTTPFPENRLRSVGYSEMQRIIIQEEPERPSTRLRKASIASRPNFQLSILNPALSTDLDWIVMKCLEKDRARRYETANGLATDIQRHLNNQTVIARPPSHVYRLAKLMRRNRRTLLSATAILFLTAGWVGSSWQQMASFLQERLARAALKRLVLEPPPWLDGEQMQLDATEGLDATSLTHLIFTVKAGETNGQKIWRLTYDATGSERQHRVMEAEADSFRPIHSHTEIGEDVAEITYEADHALVKGPHQAKVKKLLLNGLVFDNNEFPQLFRRLPLEEGYKTRLPLLSPFNFEIIILGVEVTGQETVTVPAGIIQCFKLKQNLVDQTYWYSTDPHHYLVKLQIGRTIFKLSAIRHWSSPEGFLKSNDQESRIGKQKNDL